MTAFFNKKKNNKKDEEDVKAEENAGGEAGAGLNLPDKAFSESTDAHRVIRSIYISEKSSMLGMFNQYVFKVFPAANKNLIKNKVEKLFSVKVKDVKVLNMPKKRKDIGRHPGFRSGFKKAIVVLEKGYTIEQAKA